MRRERYIDERMHMGACKNEPNAMESSSYTCPLKLGSKDNF